MPKFCDSKLRVKTLKTNTFIWGSVRLYQGTLRKHYMNPFAHMPITCMDVTRKYYACAIEYYKECVNVKALYYYYYYYYSI